MYLACFHVSQKIYTLLPVLFISVVVAIVLAEAAPLDPGKAEIHNYTTIESME